MSTLETALIFLLIMQSICFWMWMWNSHKRMNNLVDWLKHQTEIILSLGKSSDLHLAMLKDMHARLKKLDGGL